MKDKDIGGYVEDYLQRGFGSMNKNDFEVFIFNWLTSHDPQIQGESDYAISCKLKIPESKVKRLRYEAELKYGDTDEARLWKQLREALQSAQYRSSGNGALRLSIPNKQLRLFLKDQLQRSQRFFDSSFAENIVVLAVEDFLFLANKLFSEADKKILAQAAGVTIGDKTFTDLLKDCSKDAIQKFPTRWFSDNVAGELCNSFYSLFKRK